MLPPVVLSGAGSPLPFSHEVLVGRPASFSINAVCMQRHPTLSEAAQTADQHRVLSALPLKPPTSRIQSNKHGHRADQLADDALSRPRFSMNGGLAAQLH